MRNLLIIYVKLIILVFCLLALTFDVFGATTLKIKILRKAGMVSRCTAVALSHNIIVTAAHCFGFSELSTYKEGVIIHAASEYNYKVILDVRNARAGNVAVLNYSDARYDGVTLLKLNRSIMAISHKIADNPFSKSYKLDCFPTHRILKTQTKYIEVNKGMIFETDNQILMLTHHDAGKGCSGGALFNAEKELVGIMIWTNIKGRGITSYSLVRIRGMINRVLASEINVDF